MTTLVLEKEPLVDSVKIANDRLIVDLNDGRSIVVPLEWYPRLMHASPRERKNWRLLGDGYAIEWPGLDEHIGVEGILAGRRSGESKQSLKRWMAFRHRATAAGVAKGKAGRETSWVNGR